MKGEEIFLALGLLVIGGVLTALPNIKFRRRNDFNSEILRASIRHNVSPNLIKAVIAQESGFDPNAKAATTSASGLMQVTRAVVTDYNNVNGASLLHSEMFNPEIGVEVGTWYLALMIKRFGLIGGLRAYYAGPGNFRAGKRANESADYATGVLTKLAAFTAETPLRTT